MLWLLMPLISIVLSTKLSLMFELELRKVSMQNHLLDVFTKNLYIISLVQIRFYNGHTWIFRSMITYLWWFCSYLYGKSYLMILIFLYNILKNLLDLNKHVFKKFLKINFMHTIRLKFIVSFYQCLLWKDCWNVFLLEFWGRKSAVM